MVISVRSTLVSIALNFNWGGVCHLENLSRRRSAERDERHETSNRVVEGIRSEEFDPADRTTFSPVPLHISLNQIFTIVGWCFL